MKPAPYFALAVCVAGASACAWVAASDPAIAEVPAGDPLFRVLGSAQEAMGDLVLVKADSYLHAGLREDITRSCDHDGEDEDHDHEAHEPSESAGGWIGKIYAGVNVTEHSHLQGDRARELMPILDFSLKLNPHNVQAVLTTAYWLRDALGDPGSALSVLERGARENPASWEIEFEAAELLFKRKDYASAAVRYEAALRKMAGTESGEFDPIRTRYRLAESLERAGDVSRALVFYREAAAFYAPGQTTPLKEAIDRKVASLGESGSR